MLTPQDEWEKNPYSQRVRRVSSDIAAEIIGRTKPDALERFGIGKIARRAFSKVAPLGPLDDDLRDSMLILKAVAAAIRARAESIDKALTLDEIAAMISDAFVTQMAESQAHLQPGHAATVLEDAFGEHPSLLDRVSVAVQEPSRLLEHRLQDLERELESRVLKTTDEEGAIGTAFVLCEQRHILTAAHVALDKRNKPRSLRLAFRYGDVRTREEANKCDATAVYSDASLDIAVLQSVNDWQGLTKCGLLRGPEGLQKHVRLAIHGEDSLRGRRVLCFGYQAQPTQHGHRLVDPCPVRATVAPHNPIRSIAFEDDDGRVEHEQPCLVLIVAEGDERIGRGMSGGPILDLETGEIVGMTIGAQRPGQIDQPYREAVERLPLAEYGFGTLLRDVAESWPGLWSCCLCREAQRGGV